MSTTGCFFFVFESSTGRQWFLCRYDSRLYPSESNNIFLTSLLLRGTCALATSIKKSMPNCCFISNKRILSSRSGISYCVPLFMLKFSYSLSESLKTFLDHFHALSFDRNKQHVKGLVDHNCLIVLALQHWRKIKFSAIMAIRNVVWPSTWIRFFLFWDWFIRAIQK